MSPAASEQVAGLKKEKRRRYGINMYPNQRPKIIKYDGCNAPTITYETT
jgi:hypothetical protein